MGVLTGMWSHGRKWQAKNTVSGLDITGPSSKERNVSASSMPTPVDKSVNKFTQIERTGGSDNQS